MMLPNVADMRDVGVFELGLALGVSGVVGGRFPEVGPTHWSGLGTVFRYRGPLSGRFHVKCLWLIFNHEEQNVVFTRLPCAQKVRGRW